MSKPSSLVDFGTPVPGAEVASRAARHSRFADIRTFVSGAMPQVKVGQIYADLDPRCEGRRVQVLRVTDDNKVIVRTVAPRTCAPRTPSRQQKDTTGAISRISLRRFKEGARGFRLVRTSPLRQVQSYLLGARIAAACGIEVTALETRLSDALIGLLGNTHANLYLDTVAAINDGSLRALYNHSGVLGIIDDALKWAHEEEIGEDEWMQVPVASEATARAVVSLI